MAIFVTNTAMAYSKVGDVIVHIVTIFFLNYQHFKEVAMYL